MAPLNGHPHGMGVNGFGAGKNQLSWPRQPRLPPRTCKKNTQPAEAFRVRDKVWLRLKNVRSTRPNKKLDWLTLPYQVTELVGLHTLQLNVPPGIHDVFHVDLVKRAASDALPSQMQDSLELQPLEVAGKEE